MTRKLNQVISCQWPLSSDLSGSGVGAQSVQMLRDEDDEDWGLKPNSRAPGSRHFSTGKGQHVDTLMDNHKIMGHNLEIKLTNMEFSCSNVVMEICSLIKITPKLLSDDHFRTLSVIYGIQTKYLALFLVSHSVIGQTRHQIMCLVSSSWVLSNISSL